MGGKMNLNPLKKDDNTDALVKALEDANATGAAPVMPTPDDAVIASDPQVVAAGVQTPVDQVDSTVPAEAIMTESPVTEELSATDTAAVADATSNLSFDGNDLPSGISSDADAHLQSSTGQTTSEGTGDDSELDEVKNSALEQLRPLIEKLDLEPADKFDKYLMMLRASDDPALIKPAFDAAQGIAGEQEKAQALLDIINEINYITASKQQQ
jgi:hypothetical protein